MVSRNYMVWNAALKMKSGEYELLDVGEPAQNVNGVYFRTSTGSNALTVGTKS